MSSRTKLLIGIAVIVVLAAVFFALRGPNAPLGPSGSPTQSSVVPQPPTTALPPTSTPTRPGTEPKTIAEDLTNVGSRDIDHRGMNAKVQMEKAPKVAFTYERKATLPTLPEKSIPVTEFVDINQEYAKEVAKRFGFRRPSLFPRGDVYDISELDLQVGSGQLRISRTSGYLTYMTLIPGPAAAPAKTHAAAIERAKAYLDLVQLSDPSFLPANTYERKDMPGIIYVEYHRAWDPLPIFQPLGLVTSSIRTIGVSEVADPMITKTSDKRDGKVRPADFNTVTVSVDAEGRILEVVSNLRPIKEVHSGRAILNPEDAWTALTSGGPSYALVIPNFADRAGKTWDELFPAGTAASKSATVTEALLAYVELPSTQRQQYLQPAYIFRGTATLESGIASEFVVAVPALADSALPTP